VENFHRKYLEPTKDVILSLSKEEEYPQGNG